MSKGKDRAYWRAMRMSFFTTISPANASYRIIIFRSYSISEKAIGYSRCLSYVLTCSIRASCRSRGIGKESSSSNHPLQVPKVERAQQVQPSSHTKEQEVARSILTEVAITSLNILIHFSISTHRTQTLIRKISMKDSISIRPIKFHAIPSRTNRSLEIPT